MLAAVLFLLLWASPPAPEPDGSRTVGVVPPFRGEPAPPAWLRPASHALAAPDCRHYVYEAYAEAGGAWLVRYLNLPAEAEVSRLREQIFLYAAGGQAQALAACDVQCRAHVAVYAQRTFVLVDRRDLVTDPSPGSPGRQRKAAPDGP